MRGFLCPANVRFWPKVDTRGRILGPKIGHPAFFGHLSVRYRPKADISNPSAKDPAEPEDPAFCRERSPIRRRTFTFDPALELDLSK